MSFTALASDQAKRKSMFDFSLESFGLSALFASSASNITVFMARSGCVMISSEWKLTGRRLFPRGDALTYRQPICIKGQSLCLHKCFT